MECGHRRRVVQVVPPSAMITWRGSMWSSRPARGSRRVASRRQRQHAGRGHHQHDAQQGVASARGGSFGRHTRAALQPGAEVEHGHGHDRHGKHQQGHGQVQALRQRQGTGVPPLVERTDDRVGLVEEHAAQDRPDQEDQRVPFAHRQAGQRRAGAPASHDEADAEQHAAGGLRAPVGVEHIKFGGRDQPPGGEILQTDQGCHDRREHDLDDGHVAEIEDARETAAAAEAGLFEEPAEEEADQSRGQQTGGRVEQIAREKGGDHDHCLLTNQAAAKPPAKTQTRKTALPLSSSAMPERACPEVQPRARRLA